VSLPGLRLGERDQLLHVLRGHANVQRERAVACGDEAHHVEVAHQVEGKLRVERGIDGAGAGRAERDRIAVGRGARHRFRGEIASGARAVLDDESLAEGLGEARAVGARDDVVRAAGGESDHDAHGPRRVGLRERGSALESQRPREQRQQGPSLARHVRPVA